MIDKRTVAQSSCRVGWLRAAVRIGAETRTKFRSRPFGSTYATAARNCRRVSPGRQGSTPSREQNRFRLGAVLADAATKAPTRRGGPGCRGGSAPPPDARHQGWSLRATCERLPPYGSANAERSIVEQHVQTRSQLRRQVEVGVLGGYNQSRVARHGRSQRVSDQLDPVERGRDL